MVVEGVDPYQALRADPGLRSMLESSLYSDNVTFAAIVDVRGIAVAHHDPDSRGAAAAARARTCGSCWLALRSGSCGPSTRTQGRNLEWRKPLLLGEVELGAIRIGVSTLLIRDEPREGDSAGRW